MAEKAAILFVKPTEEILFKASPFYCAQPNLGIVKARSYVVIEVQARPFKCTAMNFKDHLFLVQAIVMKKDDGDFIQAWQSIGNPAEIMNHRLSCRFEFTPIAES
ncbi:uncharacterized protein TRIADDRAFT_53597 [Trichoplax adhaerens]|uniref:MSP domain-containing protein n=1 Tax=Trichoplax adhaerens TaxID=10228 RepID=B3RPM9_TRIAD|nr:hypothetical protein TRIADDRAFT_53597 [Trichoplax adhaerens]EDV27662.1 hypothetical protein TRIADDRAFT_53597 [Trichoplax adhaerens]|eukprot:XP_002109496.1 hypothetical protein TRIADDRAFT_53597 [Trichoplax adhaerens]